MTRPSRSWSLPGRLTKELFDHLLDADGEIRDGLLARSWTTPACAYPAELIAEENPGVPEFFHAVA